MLIGKEINNETYFLATSFISEFDLGILVYGFYNTYESIFMSESLAFFFHFIFRMIRAYIYIYTVFDLSYFNYIYIST